MKFLKALEIKVQGHADKQFQSKEFKGDYTGVSFGPNQMGDDNFLFGQKGEILFSNDGSQDGESSDRIEEEYDNRSIDDLPRLVSPPPPETTQE